MPEKVETSKTKPDAVKTKELETVKIPSASTSKAKVQTAKNLSDTKVEELETVKIPSASTSKAKAQSTQNLLDVKQTPSTIKPSDKPKEEDIAAKKAAEAIAKAKVTKKAAEEAENEAKLALQKVEAAKKAAEEAAEEEYKAIAAEVKASNTKKKSYTFKRQSEEIFRRDMGEPEFYLHKKDRFPRPILTPQQQESLTRKAEVPQDQTPKYAPEHILSPEFEGVSNYEQGVMSYLQKAEYDLKTIENNKQSTQKAKEDARNKVAYLESLHENFYIGMNVFRTAKGGRNKIKA